MISVKLKEENDKAEEAEKRERKAKILELLEKKKDEEMAGKSVEELQKELASL